MAKRILYEVPTPPEPDTAREELDQLVENLSNAGVLRFANDLLKASPEVSEILLRGINTQESRNAVQNLSLLVMALGRLPPERMATITRAFTEGLDSMEEAATDKTDERPPGVFGFYRLLHDEELWAGLRPVLAGLKGFSDRIHEPPEKPAAKREAERNSK
ncbi:DUF1641 domain-containing protein [Marinobacter nanhaiticus D15-8W]|uniref:DUF1641 domain-containing protein n=1 Tax=Marinobacter nanhaiticus D15-8W TaxID=626887 RepID=N6WWS0_9GAMM|nr:DUF1641 domain-containing protein [Marinobacter nanhaiticus]ENO13243.1 DUF1641 domain-containing protein [Marinobacter nanhaiticus D15-8W]BES70605.1 DUF1641 domain-containing protein [Marinobacter nanhaiticus D15-8W]